MWVGVTLTHTCLSHTWEEQSANHRWQIKVWGVSYGVWYTLFLRYQGQVIDRDHQHKHSTETRKIQVERLQSLLRPLGGPKTPVIAKFS